MSLVKMPCCGRILKNHAAFDGSDKKPRPGDVSVCASCASILWFDDQCKPRLPTMSEAASLTKDEMVMLAAAQNQVRAGGLKA